MYLRMNVGVYQGEIRGPMQIEAARHLIATGQATKAEFDPETGGFKVPEPEPVEVSASAENEAPSHESTQPRRRR